MNQKLVSVIVPNYNYAHFLKRSWMFFLLHGAQYANFINIEEVLTKIGIELTCIEVFRRME